jgi:phage terminase Nu1 subunit (DNA packaging protein)
MKKPKVEDISSVVVPAKVLSDVIGVSERRIRQLAEEGILVKTSRGRYSFGESVKNYIVYLKTTSDLETTNIIKLDLDEERAKHERLKREKTQLQLKVMKAELHYSGDVEVVMNDMLSNFRAKIIGLPAKVAPILISKNKVSDIQEILQKQCYEVLEELSNYDPKLFYNDKCIDFEEDLEEGGGGEEGT